MNAYATLLGNAGVRRLVVGASIARLPTAMLPLAILLLVVETNGSLAAAGLVAGVFGLGRAAVSPAVGALIDRAGQPRVLIGGSVVQAALLVALVAAATQHLSLFVVGAVATAAGAASPPVQAALRALWPLVTQPAQQESAYAFDATSQELIWIAGPLIVAAIVGLGSAVLAVLAGATLGCGGVAMFATTPASGAAPRNPGGRLLPGALADPGLAPLVGISLCGGFAWGAQTVGLSALAVQLGDRKAAGLLLAVLSIGSICGGLLIGGRDFGITVIGRLRALLLAAGLLTAPLLFVATIAQALPAALISGAPLAPLWAASYLLTGRIARPEAVTEAFTWTASSFALGVALGTAVGGVATESPGVHAAFALACLAPLVAWFLTPLIGDRRPVAEPAQAR